MQPNRNRNQTIIELIILLSTPSENKMNPRIPKTLPRQHLKTIQEIILNDKSKNRH